MSDHLRIAAAVCGFSLLCACGRENVFTESFFALDTAVTVTSDRKISETVRKAVTDADETFSKVCGDKRSPLSETDAQRINFCIEYTEELNSRYGGGLDPYCGSLTALWGISGDTPRVPSRQEIADTLEYMKNAERSPVSAGGTYYGIDLGAAAKGYAADMAKKALDDEGYVGYAIVSAESSILLYGEKEGGFRIGVRAPEGSGILGSFTVPCGFVSTGGGYERFFEEDGVRYSHIFDTETGYPVQTDLTSVTVYCESAENGGIMSDLMSTLIYCAGSERLGEFADIDGFGFIAADIGKNIYIGGLDFQPQEGSGYICKNVEKQGSPTLP